MADGAIDALDDDKDWTWVLSRTCAECGFDATTLDRAAIAPTARAAVTVFTQRLAEPEAAVRPSPAVWSPLEYGCHVRDVCRRFAERLRLMLTEHDPTFANWDQDATARELRYWDQDPAQIAPECLAAGDAIASAFAAVADDAWQRPGRRSNGAMFTVESLGRYFVHDLMHHLHDIGRPLN
jgi:hypothetical protein